MDQYKYFLEIIDMMKNGYIPERQHIDNIEAYFVCKSIETGCAQYSCDKDGLLLTLDGKTYRANRDLMPMYLSPDWYNFLIPYVNAASISEEESQTQSDPEPEIIREPENNPVNNYSSSMFDEFPVEVQEIDSIASDDITYVAAAVRIMKGNSPSYMSSKIVTAPITMDNNTRMMCWYELNGKSGVLISGENQPVYITDGDNETFYKVTGRIINGRYKIDAKGIGQYNTDNRFKEGGKGGHIIIKDTGVTVHIVPRSFNVSSPEYFYYIMWDDGQEMVGDNKGGIPEFYHMGKKFAIHVRWEIDKEGKKIMRAAVALA